ncbi:GyrI-like domain-containing protein [Pseudomonadota bacterium]
MNSAVSNSYENRINTVCDYIEQHLGDELSVDQLSKVANFSKYHFHRQFSAYTGINVSKYIQLLRLKRASYQLVFSKERRIIDIALDARFENPESFSRAFKGSFGQTPSQFRKSPKWKPWGEKYQFIRVKEMQNVDVELVSFDGCKVAVLEHLGDPALINESVSKFIEWRKASGESPIGTSQRYGVGLDDPKSTPADEFRFDVCGTVNEDVSDNAYGVTTKEIPGGRCARVRHHGSYETMGSKVCYLYGEWLPQSGESLRDFPVFFHYIKTLPETEEHELMTDIYLPLA